MASKTKPLPLGNWQEESTHKHRNKQEFQKVIEVKEIDPSYRIEARVEVVEVVRRGQLATQVRWRPWCLSHDLNHKKPAFRLREHLGGGNALGAFEGQSGSGVWLSDAGWTRREGRKLGLERWAGASREEAVCSCHWMCPCRTSRIPYPSLRSLDKMTSKGPLRWEASGLQFKSSTLWYFPPCTRPVSATPFFCKAGNFKK